MRPNSIKLFEICFFSFAVIDMLNDIVRVASRYDTWVKASGASSADFQAFFTLLGALIAPFVFLIFVLLVSLRKNKISFWITTILSVIFIVGGIAIIFDSISSNSLFSYDNIATVVMIGLVSVGLMFLYQKDSRDWLRY